MYAIRSYYVVITSRVENGEIIDFVGERIIGRVLCDDLVSGDGRVVFKRNHVFSASDVPVIKEEGFDKIKIRSVITCEEKYGFCAMCYGSDLVRGHLVSIGETVGVIAAQSIGEPGTQLTMRTFHIGGTATAGAQVNKTEVKTAGHVKFENLKVATREDGSWIIIRITSYNVCYTKLLREDYSFQKHLSFAVLSLYLHLM